MITVKFFAQLSEALGCTEVELAIGDIKTLLDVKNTLQAQLPKWADVEHIAMLSALNHELVPWQTQVQDGDEVAFFPPVTGG